MRSWKLLLLLLLLCAQGLHAQAVLVANPGPANNGNSAGTAVLFDVEATTGIVLTGLTTGSAAPLGNQFTLNVYTRDGTALGGPLGIGPGSSPAGWTLRGNVVATQGPDGISLPISLPDITIPAGRIIGFAVQFVDVPADYDGTGTPPIEVYSNGDVTLRTGDARTVPFTTTGSFFSSRALVGSLLYRRADPVLVANPGPANNGGADGSGMFFNVQSSTGALLTGMEIVSSAAPGSSFEIDIFTRSGSALGNTATSGPASSSAGWTERGTVSVAQGLGNLSLPIALPPLAIPAGQTLGVGLVFRGTEPDYFGTGTPPLETYTSAGLTLVTGDAMSRPFTQTGTHFSSRALVGSLSWHPLRETLPANQSPPNNGSSVGSGMFLDLTADTPLTVNSLRLATEAVAGSTFQVRMFTRVGSALGSTQTSGPSSSNAGWTLHSTLAVTQAATGKVSLPVSFPELQLDAGDTIGVGLVFDGADPNYNDVAGSQLGIYSSSGLNLVTGEARNAPFTTTGSFFVSRELVGTFYFRSDAVFEDGFE